MRYRHVLNFAITVLSVIATARDAVHGQGRMRRIAPDVAIPLPGAVAPEAVDDSDEAPDGTRSIVLPDNGDLRRKLEHVRQQIDGQHVTEAARQLGQFLQDPEIHDFFLSRDEQRRDGRGFLAETRRLLQELPATGKTAYREQFEAVARTRLNAAIADGNESVLRDVAARFPETRPGDEALYRLGHLLRDHGRAAAAAACLARLQARPEAAVPFEPALSRMLAACRDDMTNSRANLGPSAADQDWPTLRGNPARNAVVPARPPFLAPRWSRPAAGDARTRMAIERSSQSYSEGSGTALPLLNPLAVGDLAFVRTPRGVAAFDLATGDCRWRQPSDDEGENAGLDRIIWQEPAGGAFSADDECVYLIDDLPSGNSDSNRLSENRLSAREHFRAREGNLRWQVGGRDGATDLRLAGAVFLGPPLPWHGSLYVLVESKGALSLAALDRLTGRLSWSQELGTVEQRISDDLLRLVGGATPSISADDVIVCPSSGGVVVALDLSTRSLLWAYRYAQKPSAQPVTIEETVDVPRLDQFDRWLDGTLSIAAGRVILTPLESREIHCLDLSDGRPIWTKAREDGMFVACITDEAVVVVGRSAVRAYRLSDGDVAWTLLLSRENPEHGVARASADRASADREHPPLMTRTFPAGRGVFTGERYFLPVTSAAVLEFELSTGALAAIHKSPRELAAGNMIWHRGLFLSQGPASLEVFDEREALVDQVRERLERNPRDAEALVRRGELELSAGNVAQAICAFRSAHEAAPSPKTKSRLTGALLDGVRRNLPGHESLSAELDALIGP